MTTPGPVVLITARCRDCGQIAAKYWQYGDGRGAWATRFPLNDPDLPEGANLRHMVSLHPCECGPEPALPSGDELAALIERAHERLEGRRVKVPRRLEGRSVKVPRGPVTIRVTFRV